MLNKSKGEILCLVRTFLKKFSKLADIEEEKYAQTETEKYFIEAKRLV